MKINFKSTILLLGTAALCLTASCESKNSSEKENGEVSTMLEAIELGADPQKVKEEKSIFETINEVTPSRERGQWDGNTLIYKDEGRCLSWDISAFQNWDVVDEERMPKQMQFAAISEDYDIVALLSALPLKDKSVTSAWLLPQEEVLGQTLNIQIEAFPATTIIGPKIEKVNYQGKEAYQITYKAEVPDNRHGEEVIVPYDIRTMAVVSDHELVEVGVMLPQSIIDEFGDDAYNVLLSKFNIAGMK